MTPGSPSLTDDQLLRTCLLVTLSKDQVLESTWKRMAQCPMRGHRLAELSCGKFFDVLKEMCDLNLADLLLKLPAELDPTEKGMLLQDFERARSQLLFILTLKLSSLTAPPLLLFGISSFDLAASIAATRTCLQSTCSHPKIQQLQSEPLCSQAWAYCRGDDIEGLEVLAEFAAELRFGFSSERLVEGGHAVVHMRGTSARGRTEAYDSLALRYR